MFRHDLVSRTFHVLIILVTLALVSSGSPPMVRSDPVNYTLFGRVFPSPTGWGFTESSISNPGPSLSAFSGETVNLDLHSADGITHNWGIDVNNNGIPDAGEPFSPNFSGNTQHSFQVTLAAGTYTYRCTFHAAQMRGTFTVTPPQVHDAAVTGLTVSRNFAYSGVTSTPVTVDVTVANQGPVTETLTVTAKADSTIIGTQTLTLTSGASQTVSFNWDASSFAVGVYTLSGEVSLSGTTDTDPGDNMLSGVIFTVRFRGDVNSDCVVNVGDLASVGAAFGATIGPPPSANWNPNTDLNNDGVVNVSDLATVGSSFGLFC